MCSRIIIATIRSEKIANSIINKMILREELKSSRNDISLEALNYEKTNIKVIGRDEKTISDVIILNMTISFYSIWIYRNFYGVI